MMFISYLAYPGSVFLVLLRMYHDIDNIAGLELSIRGQTVALTPENRIFAVLQLILLTTDAKLHY